MLQKFLLTGIAMGALYTTFAQDTTAPAPSPSFKLSGSVDAYYRFNFNNPKTGPYYNSFTSFTPSQNSFELGMASVKAEHSVGKVGLVADLGFGRRAQDFSYNDNGSFFSLANIKQAYVTYAPSAHVKFTAGKWATHVGYELVDAYLNRNYSMSYMFSYGPFFHTGVKADFTFEKTGFMLGLANPTDFSTTTSPTKTALAQVYTGTKDDKFKAYLNYVGYFGAKAQWPTMSNLNQLDLVLLANFSSQFTAGYNGTVQFVKNNEADESQKWWGSAIYLNYDPTSTFGLTWRNEYFGDKDGVKGFDSKIFESTLSANFKIGNLKIIPELRVDAASEEIFEKSNGGATKSTVTAVVAAAYSF